MSTSRARPVLCTLAAVAAATALAAPRANAQTAPTVTTVTPPCGLAGGGDTIGIAGTGFVAPATVTFGATPSTSVTVNSATSITATAPAGAGTVDVAVSDANGTSATSSSDEFTYNPDAFGVCRFSQTFTDGSGNPFTQAGGHPASVTTTIDFNETRGFPVQNVKDIYVQLPAGFVGNPSVVGQCTEAELGNESNGDTPACPPDSQIGTLQVRFTSSAPTFNVYNMVPPADTPAEFGAPLLVGTVAHVFATVRNGGDYGLTASVYGLPELLPIRAETLTLWGVPADHATGAQPADAFLSYPQDCDAGPLTTTLQTDSWNAPGQLVSASSPAPAPTGCDESHFPPGVFAPSLTVTPSTTQADAPSGYTIDVRVPLDESGADLSTPLVRSASVTLPAGVSINPPVADGLSACTPSQFATRPTTCPTSSIIGTATIETPLLSAPLTGSIYMAAQGAGAPANPFGVDVEALGSGVDLHLQGAISADPSSGRLTATFSNNPQLPFSDLMLSFKSGARAPLANPLGCGAAITTSDIGAWPPGVSDATPSASFAVDADGAGGACPAAWPFAPGFAAGVLDPTAGAFTTFTTTLSRADRTPPLASLSLTTPPGLLATIGSVPPCGEPAASQGTCPAASAVGTTTVAAGAGSDPIYLTGTAYLTGPYGGAPFGLSIVVPGQVGPFALGSIVVRAPISVNPHTARLTIGPATLPSIVEGVALRLREVNVTIDRPGFMFNPTSCSALATGATVGGADGASSSFATPFDVGGCAALPFAPTVQATSAGATSSADGASLDVGVKVPTGSSNLRSVAVTLPSQLSVRLDTVQLSCPRATFDADPAGCPAGAIVGNSSAATPVLPVGLSGTVYLVAQAGGLPTLEDVLEGDGVTVNLTGSVAIAAGGATSTTFAAIPDVPISSFQLDLPEGPHSALASVVGNLCGQSPALPAVVAAQDGAELRDRVRVSITGCVSAALLRSYAAAVHGGRLTLVVTATGTGVLRVGAPYVKTVRRTLAAGTHRLTIALEPSAASARRRHERIAVKVSFTAAQPGARTVARTLSVRL